MVTLNTSKQSKIFLSIGINGNGKVSLRQEVDEGTINAVRRDWSVGESSGTKWEILHDSIDGIISDVQIKKEEVKGYGDKIILTFENEVVVSASTSGKFGSAIMRQLPEVDLEKPVKLFPYSYTPKGKDKESTGVSLKQGEAFDVRVNDHFFDFDNKKSKNGIPEATFEWSTVEDWEKNKFWSDVDTFLQNYVTENVIPKVSEFVAPEETAEAPAADVTEDINPEDIPF